MSNDAGNGRGADQAATGEVPADGIEPKSEGEPNLDSPFDLSAKGWRVSIKHFVQEVQQDRIPMAAAGMAYYFFLAAFPALIAAVGLLGLVRADPIFIESLVSAIERSMPGGAGAILTGAITNAQSAPQGSSLLAVIIGLGIALWSTTSGMVALQVGLDIAYDVPKGRKFFHKRLVGLGLVVVTGILGGLSAPLFTQKGWAWSVAGWLVTVASIATLFGLFYFLGPNHDHRSWRWVSAGSLLGTVIWIAASLGFTFYVTNFGSYADTYGVFAGIAVLILWLYLSSLAILLGGELNASLERRAAQILGRK